MKGFSHLFYTWVATVVMAGCTGETEEGGCNSLLPDGGTDAVNQQEILLTLDNNLELSSDRTRATDRIATDAENTVSSLDVYIFGSLTENGSYSYMQRFAYRSDKTKMPIGASELKLNIGGINSNKIEAVIRLPKGFFVKLYCIANQETLINPADRKIFSADKYIPLNYTSAQDGTITVLGEGVPSEDAFKSFYTPFINPENADDIILPPLPMSGGLVTALDLRDNKASGRLNASFRLTRAVARFDVRNNSEFTRLTVESVTMVNGRKSVSFFPIQVYGHYPTAEESDLVTYPARSFKKEDKINVNYQAGAFYSYPCLIDDEAYLLIKGKYQINKVESKDVIYSVPFKQARNEDQTSITWIEIQANHRYTINILDADEYNLQCNLFVADWNDEGSIDDYRPDNSSENFLVNIPEAMADRVLYEAASRTVYMGLEDGNTFSAFVKTNSALQVITSYQDNIQDCNWVSIGEPEVKPTLIGEQYTNEYSYTIALNKDYTGKSFPRATFRFIDLATGEGQILFVKLTGTPMLSELTEWPDAIPETSKINKFDIDTKTANLYLFENSQLPIKVICSDEIETEATLPDYLELTQLSKEGDETVYNLKVKTSPVTKAAVDQVKITFVNKNVTIQKQTLAVKVLSAAITVPEGNLVVNFAAGETASKTGISSPEGFSINPAIDWNGGETWFDLVTTGDIAAGSNKSIDIQVKSGLTDRTTANTKTATITLTNKIGGGADVTFQVEPKWLVPTNVAGQENAIDVVKGNTAIINVAVPYGGISASSSVPGMATVQINDKNEVTVTGVTTGTTTIKVFNAQKDASSLQTGDYVEYIVNVEPEEVVIIGNRKWARGNLVKGIDINSCTIGKPTDRGLYFRWGALVGYTNDNSSTPAVKPSEYSDSPPLASSPSLANVTITDSPVEGTGDPCRYYLKGKWRLPTSDEYLALGRVSTVNTMLETYVYTQENGVNGIRIPKEGTSYIFFPVAGNLNEYTGIFQGITRGYYWSSSPCNASSSWRLDFDNSSAIVTYTNLTNGLSVRCIKEM